MPFWSTSQRAAASPDLLALAQDALATYRLTVLIQDDRVSERLRRAVWRRYGAPDRRDSHPLSFLLACPWCLGMHLSVAVVIGRTRAPRYWSPVARMLALSALTGLLAEAKDRLSTDPD